jgi:hypothetical protein
VLDSVRQDSQGSSVGRGSNAAADGLALLDATHSSRLASGQQMNIVESAMSRPSTLMGFDQKGTGSGGILTFMNNHHLKTDERRSSVDSQGANTSCSIPKQYKIEDMEL